MKELIKVTTNEQGHKLVSARELYKGLGFQRTNWNNWSKKNIIENEFFKENIDWIGCIVNIQGNYCKDYAISLEFGKHLAMMARTEKSHEYRQYFIECEKQIKETKPQLPTTYKDALIALVAEIEEKERIEAEKNRLIHNNKVYTVSEIAKELGFKSAQELNNDLKERKIQYKVNNTWVLCARYAELGYTNSKQTELDNGRIVYTTRWTGKGRDWLINEVYI